MRRLRRDTPIFESQPCQLRVVLAGGRLHCLPQSERSFFPWKSRTTILKGCDHSNPYWNARSATPADGGAADRIQDHAKNYLPSALETFAASLKSTSAWTSRSFARCAWPPS